MPPNQLGSNCTDSAAIGHCYEAYAPAPHLKPYIRCYFHIRVTGGGFDFPADGCPGLIINLKAPFLLGFHDSQARLFDGCRLFWCNQIDRQMLTRHQTGPTELLAVKFYPGQLPRFFDVPAMALTDTSVSLSDVWGPLGIEIQQRACDQTSIQTIIAHLDRALIKRGSVRVQKDTLVGAALGTIFTCNGRINIEDLADRFNIGRRHLERRFLANAGPVSQTSVPHCPVPECVFIPEYNAPW